MVVFTSLISLVQTTFCQTYSTVCVCMCACFRITENRKGEAEGREQPVEPVEGEDVAQSLCLVSEGLQ